jgi:CheY-like chemotaxis protein
MQKINTACIIDDDPLFVFGTKRIMQLVGFCNDFIVFQDGLEASNYLKGQLARPKTLPDIIFVDLNMPVMDGWQFLDEMGKVLSDGNVAIYVVTSSIDPKDFHRLREYSFIKGHLSKPITMEKMQALAESF